MVGTGGGHFQGPARRGLARDIAHVRHQRGTRTGTGAVGVLGLGFEVERQVLRIRAAVEGEPGQCGVAPDLCARDEFGLGHVGPGHDDLGVAGPYRCHHGREDAPHGPQPAIQSKFGDEDGAARGPDVIRRQQDGHGDGEVEARAAFGQRRRDEVGRNLPAAQRDPRVVGR